MALDMDRESPLREMAVGAQGERSCCGLPEIRKSQQIAGCRNHVQDKESWITGGLPAPVAEPATPSVDFGGRAFTTGSGSDYTEMCQHASLASLDEFMGIPRA